MFEEIVDDARTHARTTHDDGHWTIPIAHPEHSSGELKTMTIGRVRGHNYIPVTSLNPLHAG